MSSRGDLNNPYNMARWLGDSHEAAVLFHSRHIADEELEIAFRHLDREVTDTEVLRLLLKHTRQDVSAIAQLLCSVSAAQRKTTMTAYIITLLLAANTALLTAIALSS